MKAGDRIRIQGSWGELTDYTLEMFRYCLGYFESEQEREMGRFTPLCYIYDKGPESLECYMSNHGSYHTNLVPAWMDLPKEF